MEVVRELHDAVAKACEASFDNAYQQLKSQLEAQTKEAETKDLAAVQAQQKAETTIEKLQHHITLLQTELKQYEVDTREVELPGRYADLEAEFDPKALWGTALDDQNLNNSKSRQMVEAKYTALYTNLQTFIETCSHLKHQVLRHKEKLQQWDRQLKRDEFTLFIDGRKVRYRKVQGFDLEGGDKGGDKEHSQTTRSSLGKHPREQDPDLPDNIAFKLSPRQSSKDGIEASVCAKEDDLPTDSLTSELASTQSSSPGPQVEGSRFPGTTRSFLNPNRRETSHVYSPTLPRKSHARSPRGNVDSEHPVCVKNEVTSSSPMRASLNFTGRSGLGTQDLDDIGDTIRTPTKRKAYCDVHKTDTQGSKRAMDSLLDLQTYKQPTVFQTVSGNARRPIVTGQASSKRIEDLERRAIPAVAEDGDDMATLRVQLNTGNTNDQEPSEAGKSKHRRLGVLLEQSIPSKPPLCPPRKRPDPKSPKTSALPRSDRTTASISNRMASDPDPTNKPYRAMPLSCLGLEHFKINPAQNQGLDFAYDTVVRNKDDRKCISGCTRPGCCGDRFRAMARLGGPLGRNGAEQEQEDKEMLQEFVGENAHLLQNLNVRERENLLIEARARALANQYGRHRHTHQRGQSPPGFWRTDMPSTQEEELDREAAKRLEREKVEERYREAMRPGGLWIFVDE